MRRYADTFFRHWLILMVPIIVLPLGAFELARSNHTPVKVFANIWVNQATIGQISYVSSSTSPADNVAANLGQLLGSGSFDQRVAQRSPLYLRSLPHAVDVRSVVTADLSKNVQVTSNGPNTVTFMYTTKDWRVGIQVVQAIIDEMPRELHLLNSQQVVTLRQQLSPAHLRLTRSAQELRAYLRAHNISPAGVDVLQFSDSALATRYQAVQIAQSDVQSIQDQINKLGGQASASRLQVMDSPSAVVSPNSKKTLLMDLALGLLLGLMLSGVFIVLRTARDRTVRWADEVPELIGLPVLTIVPHSRSLALHGSNKLSTKRHIIPRRLKTGKAQ